ncbi:hypothetical protein L1987_85043 [Smallanthus sonchifolius]|uniref:Uncharacterized protein n=1 Tax=Smallanthus sonchifolius TaxID=185202 RepID=A0ACB8XW27_9ASTR|nr:hypothetical protein L1987_85043 [Smallanthus sonchifolius]
MKMTGCLWKAKRFLDDEMFVNGWKMNWRMGNSGFHHYHRPVQGILVGKKKRTGAWAWGESSKTCLLPIRQRMRMNQCTWRLKDLGQSSAFNSKKRPRRFRSLDDVGFDLGPLYPSLVDEDNSPLPFPDLNSVIPHTCPSAAA